MNKKKIEICIAQNLNELKYLKKYFNNKNIFFIPLDIETQSFCEIEKLNYLNPLEFIKKDFHKVAIQYVELQLNKLNYGNILSESIRTEYKCQIRNRLNSCVFLIELMRSIEDKFIVEKINISGKKQFTGFEFFQYNYYLSEIIEVLFNQNRIYKINDDKKTEVTKKRFYNFKILNKIEKKNKYIILNSPGYRFKRFILSAFRKNLKTIIIQGKPKNFIKRIILYLLGVRFLNFKKINLIDSTLSIPQTSFVYDQIDLTKIIYSRTLELLTYLDTLEKKSVALKELFQNKNILLFATNITRGFDGNVIELAQKNKVPTLEISHGTIAKNYNQFDYLYKKLIAESVFGGKSDYIAIQTKICEESTKIFQSVGKKIKGNLIFAESKKDTKAKHIMYAATLKDFVGYQFYGVEMYYEFYQNLKELNKFAKENNHKVIVKLNSDRKLTAQLLSKIFKNLIFSYSDIQKILKKCFVTISHSSTVIEDSLNSKIPVILLDVWKRYKHCESEEDPNKKNCSIYYVNNFNNLGKAIETIKSSQNLNLNDYLYPKSAKMNIDTIINAAIEKKLISGQLNNN